MVPVVKNPPANKGSTRDMGSILGLGRFPGVENGHLLQYSCLENSMDSGALQTIVRQIKQLYIEQCKHYYF